MNTQTQTAQFNLSEKIVGVHTLHTFDVKEFIRLLKEELKTDLTGCFTSQKQCDEWNEDTNKIIDALAGEKLC